MPLRMGTGIGVPFVESGAGWNPALANWKNYGDMTSAAQIPLLFANSNYTGAAVDGAQVLSIQAGAYGTRGLKESAINGPVYFAGATVDTYTGPILYFGGGRRLLADAAAFDDFGSHSVMMVGAFRTGPTAGAIWTKGFNADGRGTVEINTSEYRMFNTIDTGTGQFVPGTHHLESLEYIYEHSTGIHTFWRNGTVIYNGTGPGTDGGRTWCLGQGSGGFGCADFYCLKWAMKAAVMSASERLGQRAYWGL